MTPSDASYPRAELSKMIPEFSNVVHFPQGDVVVNQFEDLQKEEPPDSTA